MDAFITAVGQTAPQFGISGILITVILILLRREANAEGRHAAELERISKAHDAELGELRIDIAALRAQVKELHGTLDDERAQRRTAEDTAAQVKRARRGGTL